MSGSYLESLRGALGNVPGPIGFLVSENASILDFLRGLRGSPAQAPAASPTTVAPVDPASNAPIPPPPPAPPAPGGAPAAPQNESPEMIQALQQFQNAYARGLAGNAPQQSAPSNAFLDMLRQRVKDQIAREPMTRLSDIGAGMLASGSPNFFTMLGQGLQAGQQQQRQRLDVLRQAAEVERQVAQQRAEEEYRREQNRIQAERYEAERPLREAQAAQARALAGYYEAGGRGAGANRGELTPLALANIRRQAEADALREIPEPRETLLDTPAARADREARRRALADQIEARRLAAAAQALRNSESVPAGPASGTPPAAPTVPRITVGPGGQSAR